MKKRQPKRSKRNYVAMIALLIGNLVTAFILVAFFAPHWLPFMRTNASVVEVPVTTAPADGTKVGKNKIAESGKPVRVKVPAVSLDIPVVDGVYNENSSTWTLSDNNAHYALITPFANNVSGNTFIYGHRNGVFGALLGSKPGDKAYVETDNNKVFTYTLREFKDVSPTDLSLFSYKGDPILTLQTCSGNWDQHRRLFTFQFNSVEKI